MHPRAKVVTVLPILRKVRAKHNGSEMNEIMALNKQSSADPAKSSAPRTEEERKPPRRILPKSCPILSQSLARGYPHQTSEAYIKEAMHECRPNQFL